MKMDEITINGIVYVKKSEAQPQTQAQPQTKTPESMTMEEFKKVFDEAEEKTAMYIIDQLEVDSFSDFLKAKQLVEALAEAYAILRHNIFDKEDK